MNASFEEKSVWIQLLSLLAASAAYCAVAGIMLSKGVTSLVPFVAIFAVATVLLVILLIIGHMVAAIASKPEERDERDQVIEWRAESNSSWVLGVGVFAGIVGLVMSWDNAWIAHVLMFSLLLSQVACYVFQIIYYRRGM